MRSLIECVDNFSTDALRHTSYQRYLQRQHNRRNQRDGNRRNEVADEDFERLRKFHAESRRNALINGSQIKNQCDSINEFAAQGLAKLFMAQAIHEKQ